MLILLNLLGQCGSVVCQVFQLNLNLCNTLHPGLALCSCGLADAGGINGRRTDITHKNVSMRIQEKLNQMPGQVPLIQITDLGGQLSPVLLQVSYVSLVSVDGNLGQAQRQNSISYLNT